MTKKTKFWGENFCTGDLKSIAKFQKFNDFLYLSRVVFFSLWLWVMAVCVRAPKVSRRWLATAEWPKSAWNSLRKSKQREKWLEFSRKNDSQRNQARAARRKRVFRQGSNHYFRVTFLKHFFRGFFLISTVGSLNTGFSLIDPDCGN